MSRVRRLWSLCGIARQRVAGRARIAPQRVALTVAGVALAIGLMVSVTGIAFGLASQSVVESEEVDYWIVPEGASTESVVVSTGGLQLGDVHATARTIDADDRVEYATPVMISLLSFQDAATDVQRYILTVGIVPQPDIDVLGLSATPLTSGDPYFNSGSYDGQWTGELVMNDAAGTVLNASTGTTLNSSRAPNRSFTVVNVSESQATGVGGTVPVALMHLSELQALSGAQSGDQANQILVSTNNRNVRGSLTDQYPRTQVVERSGLSAQEVSTSNLPLAVALAALISAVVVGVLFVTTLMGLEVNASRQELGMLAAMGFARRSRSLVIAVETVLLSLVGGILGIGLGSLGIIGINTFGVETLGLGTIALFDPLMAVYALGVAAVIGVIGAIYPVLLSSRTTQLEVLSQ